MQNFTSKDEGSLELDSGRFKHNMVLEEALPVSNVNVDILMAYPQGQGVISNNYDGGVTTLQHDTAFNSAANSNYD